MQLEDDNCFARDQGSMYLEFDGDEGLALGGPTTPGTNKNGRVELYAGSRRSSIVAFTTDLAQNEDRCVMTIASSSPDRTAGTFSCTGLTGARLGSNSSLIPLPGRRTATDVSGTFEIR
jgi:hypothetical protein